MKTSNQSESYGQSRPALKCPKCRLINPHNAMRCDCGYVFPTVPSTASSNVHLAPDERQCPECGQVIKKQAVECWYCAKVPAPRMVDSNVVASNTNIPTLGWQWVLLFEIITLRFFGTVWLIRQGNWAKKVDPSSIALGSSVASILLYISSIFLFGAGVNLAAYGAFCFHLAGAFSVRQTIEAQFNRRLSGVLTFFLGPIYLQYHFDQIAKNR